MPKISKKKIQIYEETLAVNAMNKKSKKGKEITKIEKALKKDLKRARKRAKYTLSIQEIKDLLPQNYKGIISVKLVNNINNMLMSSSTGVDMKKQIIGFADVLSDGRYSIQQYISAVQYIHYRLQEYSQLKAFKKSHYTTYQLWVKKEKICKKVIKGRIGSYNRGKLVQALYAQNMIPAHMLFQDHYYKAIRKQTTLLNHTNGIVAQRAADSLMSHLAPPPDTTAVLDVGSAGASMVKEMFAGFAELATKQREVIKKKEVSVVKVIQAKLVTKNKSNYDD